MIEQNEFSPGQEIGGTYRIIRPLGAGVAGTVYEAEHMHLGGRYALKAFTPRQGDTERLKRKFMAEGKILANLDHPNIV